jgi:predicted dehydrogenase
VFKLDDAPKAYDMLVERSEPFVGMLIEYDASKPVDLGQSRVQLASARPLPITDHRSPITAVIGFIGAGSYAQSHLLPNLPKGPKVVLKGVLTATGASSRSVAERFGFEFATGDEKELLGNPDVNTIFIATRHDSHARYVLAALRAGKHVFVEKPLCLTPEELSEIESCHTELGTQHPERGFLMVGYNRRFSPLIRELKGRLGSGPIAMAYRVNAGPIPGDSWIQDPEVGGGRVIGEVCHFLDLLGFLAGSRVKRVHAAALRAPGGLDDTLTVTLTYANGSIGSVSYFANGDKSLSKERLEVFANGCSYVLHDFKTLTVHAKGKKRETKVLSQDKGQKDEVRLFVEHILEGKGPLISPDDLFHTSRVTLGVLESLRRGQAVEL